MTDSHNDRWKSEAEFFDREARRARSALSPMPPAVVDRYVRHRRRRWNLEHRLRLLGDLSGRRVLDVGCGDGNNSILLAMLGATVTGIDVSQESIAVAREKAKLNGVERRVTFECTPIESTSLSGEGYDVVWVDAVLHHLIPVLRPTLDILKHALNPGGDFIASEPINLSPMLRSLRLRLPVDIHASPDERPLEAAEIATIDEIFPQSQKYYFHGYARALRWILPHHQYETASRARRILADLTCAIDVAALSLPYARRLAGVCVMHWKNRA